MGAFIKIFVDWFPMIVPIAVWIFFMRKMRGPQIQTVVYLKRQNELMEEYIKVSERVAFALEKISKIDKKIRFSI